MISPSSLAGAVRAATTGLWRAESCLGRVSTTSLYCVSTTNETTQTTESNPLPGATNPASPATNGVGDDPHAKLTPRAVVERLNRFIVGQHDAKKAVAIAFRNRWRRHRVPENIREDIVPKNILMIGPTGCGKTEIARRLAKLADAPFIKVEATKFTEVGYHGRDVESIIQNLLENAINLVRHKFRTAQAAEVKKEVDGQLLRALLGPAPVSEVVLEQYRTKLDAGELESTVVDIEVAVKMPPEPNIKDAAGTIMMDMRFFQNAKKEKRKMLVAEARPLIEEQVMEAMFPPEELARQAIKATEQDGIVFIDEIDKIVSSRSSRYGVDPSSEGVQRDLLPIIEGSTVTTKHGNVRTDHILFVCSGAFHSCKPSDMMAELQGRLPIRVELRALSREDFYKILTEPDFNLVKQQQALLSTEGVDLHFTDAAVQEVAAVSEEINRSSENIGARRLHTVLERIVEDISFRAPALAATARADGRERATFVVDKELVVERVSSLVAKGDLKRFIL